MTESQFDSESESLAMKSPERPRYLSPAYEPGVVNLLTDPPVVNLCESETEANEEAEAFAALIPKHDIELKCPLFSPKPVMPTVVPTSVPTCGEVEAEVDTVADTVVNGKQGLTPADVLPVSDSFRVFIYVNGDGEVMGCFTSVERARIYAQRNGDGGVIEEHSMDRPMADDSDFADDVRQHSVYASKPMKRARMAKQ